MKRVTLLALLFGLLNLAHGQKEFSYPLTFSDTTADTYFGDRISDPNRWMENPSDPRLLTWLEEQQNFTKKVSNGQTRKWELRAQLASMYHDVNRDKISSYRERNKKFTNKYDFEEKLTNFSKSSDLLFKLRDSQNYRLLIKAKDYQKQKGDKIDYTSKIVNEVNDLAVVTISVNGSDWNTGYTFDLKSGQRLPHVLQNLKGSNVCWFVL